MNEIISSISSCKQIPGVEIKAVMITPHVAEKLLNSNTHNRKISTSVVNKYVSEINNDEWMLSAQGIGFDRNGVLCDGQHRLSAIVASGKTIPMLIVYGLAPKSQEKVDRQRKRTLYDAFYLAGYADKKKQVQIATFIANLNNRWNNTASDSEIKNTLEIHIDSINAVLDGGEKNDKGIGRIGFLAACVFYHEIAAQKALHFISQVRTGSMLTLDDPSMRLRKYLLGECGYVKLAGARTKGINGGGAQLVDYRKTIYAINAHISGKKIAGLKEAEEIQIGALREEKAA